MSIDYSKMPLLDALNLAVSLSGMTREDIAAAMGWNMCVANRVFGPDNYWPSTPSIPRLCVVLGNTVILDWFKAQAEAGGCILDFKALDAQGLVMGMGELFADLGAVAQEGQRAIENGRIEKHEASELIRRLHRLAGDTLRTITDLRGCLSSGERP